MASSGVSRWRWLMRANSSSTASSAAGFSWTPADSGRRGARRRPCPPARVGAALGPGPVCSRSHPRSLVPLTRPCSAHCSLYPRVGVAHTYVTPDTSHVGHVHAGERRQGKEMSCFERKMFRNGRVSLSSTLPTTGVRTRMTTDDKLHERRWWALAVLCLSLTGDRTGQHHPQRGPAVAGHGPRTPRPASCSGSSTATRSCSPVCCSRPAASATASAAGAPSRSGSPIFGVGSLRRLDGHVGHQLIFTRAFMGIGAALIMPATLSLLTNVFTRPEERGRAIGVWAAVAGAGGAIGPLLGGLPAAALLVGLGLPGQRPGRRSSPSSPGASCCPTSKDPSAPPLDPFGAVLSVVGLVAAAVGDHRGARRRAGPTRTVVAGFVRRRLIVLAGFVTWELHCRPPDARHALLQEPPLHGGQHRPSR